MINGNTAVSAAQVFYHVSVIKAPGRGSVHEEDEVTFAFIYEMHLLSVDLKVPAGKRIFFFVKPGMFHNFFDTNYAAVRQTNIGSDQHQNLTLLKSLLKFVGSMER